MCLAARRESLKSIEETTRGGGERGGVWQKINETWAVIKINKLIADRSSGGASPKEALRALEANERLCPPNPQHAD